MSTVFTDEYLWHLAGAATWATPSPNRRWHLTYPTYVPRRKVASFYAPVSCTTAVTMKLVVFSRAGRLGTVMLVQVTHDTEFGSVVDLFVEMVEHERRLVTLGVFVSNGT